MLFCACRAADVLNAFVGLWLVPKYVAPSDLGAVMPLQYFAAFISLPANVFATTFMKEITTLATHGEYGKMKSLMRGVFVGTAIFLLLAIAVFHLILPIFLERIRIENGSLGFWVLTAAFCAATAPIYTNALQALKRFNSIAIINIISAPFRFITMLIAMPFRALCGYFVGQTTQPALMIFASIFCLRKELSVPAEPYWHKPVFQRFFLFFIGLLVYHLSGGLLGLVEQTILRQRLPEIDSAAYYMTTRFSEMTGLVGGTLMTIMFPFTAEMSSQGRSTRPLVIKSSLATFAIHAILAIVFIAVGKPLISILPGGERYADYSWTIPWLIGISAISYIPGFHINTEVSAGRFQFLKWWIPLHIVLAAAILLTTGFGYFAEYLPESLRQFLSNHNFTSLTAMLWWFSITTLIKFTFSIVELIKQESSRR